MSYIDNKMKFTKTMSHQEGFVTLYINKTNRTIVRSDANSLFLRFSGMQVLEKCVSMDDSDIMINSYKKSGYTLYDARHSFHI